jgi:hypothetical protein
MSDNGKQFPSKPENQDLPAALSLADTVVYKTYLENLNDMEVAPYPEELKTVNLNDIVRFFKVERFVSEKNENSRDKLVSVFHAVASCGGSVLALIHSDGDKTGYYFGAKTLNERNPSILSDSVDALEKTLKGNFPGTKIASVREGAEINTLLDDVFHNKKFSRQEKHICTVSGVAGLRSKDENGEKLFVQGMEKLINSMQGEKYSLLLIADPVQPNQIEIIKRGYENLYSQLASFAGYELGYGENESESVSSSLSEGISKFINKSVTDTLTYTKGSFRSHTHTDTNSVNVGANIGIGIPGTPLFIGSGAGYSHSSSDSDTAGTSESASKGTSKTSGTADAESKQTTKAETAQKGSQRGIQIKIEDKGIKNLLEKIDLQLKRIDASSDTGMWNCSVYCLADVAPVCKIAASAYQSLLRGENSSVESGVITAWSKEKSADILPYIEKMYHPALRLDGEKEITPTSFISTPELTIHAGIPQNSVSGLPVLQTAPFGREVSAHWESAKNKGRLSEKNGGIRLGAIYHMGNEEALDVCLDKNSLASHTFITGSTGSGKSNTVYQILREARKSGAAFLVVEPAKGEYKNVFGQNADVAVYGTNPALTPILRINPFRFPHGSADAKKNIHILEHLDRLVEIFNVCWPMYAAMPAVLKDAIEASYEDKGWNLPSSTCIYSPAKYPAFADAAANIRKIIDRSEYDAENKGAYKGINGMIFTGDEISSDDLLDKNVIVDLSRVGSAETKALIMGLLVMKLQEYRLTSGAMNAGLRHITVLEEAHTLLKRTSTAQSAESSNLLGKSVEMLANAIAEMRTYGEGFIIADQSPGLLDMSVIRNTNTKIILRLPDEGDRELVGKAAGLNDDQIVELARLQRGVAAVYQNDWLQPVLCKVDEFKVFDKNQIYQKPDTASLEKANALAELTRLAATGEQLSSLKEIIERIDFAVFKTVKPETIAALFPNNEEVFIAAVNDEQVKKTPKQGLYDYLIRRIEPALAEFKTEYRYHILKCIVGENCKYHSNLRDIPAEWEQFIDRKGARLV